MIHNGQPVNEETDNNAFMSRTNDTDTVGKVDLKNDDAASGAHITNVKKQSTIIRQVQMLRNKS